MPDDRQNVVPFQQDAGFFARRALKKQKDGLFQQAVVLLRRALEAAPDHPGYLLDMAETYSEMGCPLESNRCLLRLMRLQPALGVCWFGMACNLFAMGNVQGAQLAALEYLEREPEGEYSAQAADMIAAIQQARQLHIPAGRQALRVYRLNERAAARLNGEHPAQAVRLLEKSLAVTDAPDTRALLAYALSETGRFGEAADAADTVIRTGGLSAQGRLNAFLALTFACQREKALAFIDAMDERSLEPYELRRVLDALFCLKHDRDALQPRLSRALRLSPFDRGLLHAQAAAFYNDGDKESALIWWRHMLEINPDDVLAAILIETVTDGQRLRQPIPMFLALPEELREAQEAILYAQDSGEPLLRACRLELLSRPAGAKGCATAFQAVKRLGALSDEQSETLLREALIEPALPMPVKLAAMDALSRRGAAEPFLIVGRDSLSPAPPDEPAAPRRRRTWPGR